MTDPKTELYNQTAAWWDFRKPAFERFPSPEAWNAAMDIWEAGREKALTRLRAELWPDREWEGSE